MQHDVEVAASQRKSAKYHHEDDNDADDTDHMLTSAKPGPDPDTTRENRGASFDRRSGIAPGNQHADRIGGFWVEPGKNLRRRIRAHS